MKKSVGNDAIGKQKHNTFNIAIYASINIPPASAIQAHTQNCWFKSCNAAETRTLSSPPHGNNHPSEVIREKRLDNEAILCACVCQSFRRPSFHIRDERTRWSIGNSSLSMYRMIAETNPERHKVFLFFCFPRLTVHACSLGCVSFVVVMSLLFQANLRCN